MFYILPHPTEDLRAPYLADPRMWHRTSGTRYVQTVSIEERDICNPPFAPLWAVGAKKQENKGHLKANNTCLSFWKWFFQINLPKHTTLVSSTTKNPRILRLDTFQRLEFFMKPQLGWYTMYLDKRSSICVSWIFCTCVPGDISTEHAVYTLKFWKNQVYIKKT